MSAGRPGLTFARLAALTVLALAPSRALGSAEGLAGRTLTLQECVSLALRENPATEVARQGLEAARERVGEARAGYYPAFKLSAGYTYTAAPAMGASASPDLFDTRLSVRQVLYDGGQTAGLVEGARLGIGARDQDLRRSRLDVALEVRTAFYEALRRRDLAAVARGALETAEKHASQAEALYREGAAPRSDVIKAQVQVSNAQLEIIRAENAFLLAKAALSAAMGQPVTTAFDVAVPEDAPAPDPLSLPEALGAAPAQRPELAALRARQEAADAAVRQALSGLYPTVSLDASYGWQESDAVPQDEKWSLGISVGIPVFERRVARARVGQAQADRNGLRALEAQTLRAIELEVEQAWLQLREAVERQEVAAKIREQAEDDIRVSEGRYREGLGTLLELIDARTALTQAGTNAVVARYDRALALARLDRALGRDIPGEGK